MDSWRQGTEVAVVFGLAAAVALGVTPVAIRVAVRTSFMDRPAGYKHHGHATPYLGGAAVLIAVIAALALAGRADEHPAIIVGAALLWLLGTVDDRVAVSPLTRVLAEIGVAVLLWRGDLGWRMFDSDVLDLVATAIWVVVIVNAFNLMDNLDGAASTVGLVAALGMGGVGLASGAQYLVLLSACVAGALGGFLRYNLTSPARVFLGDGGSMPIGLLLAVGSMMAAQAGFNGLPALLLAPLLLGLLILDTTMVTLSRFRRRASVLSGGRDHLTHRMLRRAGTPRRVAVLLAGGQAASCGAAVVAVRYGTATLGTITSVAVALGLAAILVLEVRFDGDLSAPSVLNER